MVSRTPRQIVGYTVSRDKSSETIQRMVDAAPDAKRYCTDGYAGYLDVVFAKIIVIAAMCLFIVYPFYTILTKSVFSNKVEGLTLYNFIRFFTKPYYYQTLIRSMVVCFATVFTCLFNMNVVIVSNLIY